MKNLISFFKNLISNQSTENVEVVNHYYDNKKVFVNGNLVYSNTTKDLGKTDFQRVMMNYKNIICL